MVKPGYKQTETGVIPENWNAIYFRDCFEVLPNNTLSRAALNNDEGNAKNIHYGDILVKYGSLLNCSKAAIPYISNPSLHTTSKPLIDGDVVIADTAEDETVGKAVEITEVGHQLVVPGLHTIPCRAKNSNMFAPGWLGFFLNSSVYHDQLLPLITGTKVSAISKMSISDTIILVPPFPEQSQIAEALSDMDELIASLEKLIAKKKAIKQGAMQELLTGKRRLPGFSGERESVCLSEIGHFIKGSGISRADASSGKLPAVRYGELYTKHDNYVKEYYSHISFDVAQTAVPVTYGAILFAASGETKEEIGKCAAIIDDHIVYAGGDILIFMPDKPVHPVFFGTLLNTPEVCKQKAQWGQGDAIVHIHADSLSKIKVTIPDYEEQAAIADVLLSADREIDLLEIQVTKARQIKQGMLQQLLTGKMRLL